MTSPTRDHVTSKSIQRWITLSIILERATIRKWLNSVSVRRIAGLVDLQGPAGPIACGSARPASPEARGHGCCRSGNRSLIRWMPLECSARTTRVARSGYIRPPAVAVTVGRDELGPDLHGRRRPRPGRRGARASRQLDQRCDGAGHRGQEQHASVPLGRVRAVAGTGRVLYTSGPQRHDGHWSAGLIQQPEQDDHGRVLPDSTLAHGGSAAPAAQPPAPAAPQLSPRWLGFTRKL